MAICSLTSLIVVFWYTICTLYLFFSEALMRICLWTKMQRDIAGGWLSNFNKKILFWVNTFQFEPFGLANQKTIFQNSLCFCKKRLNLKYFVTKYFSHSSFAIEVGVFECVCVWMFVFDIIFISFFFDFRMFAGSVSIIFYRFSH